MDIVGIFIECGGETVGQARIQISSFATGTGSRWARANLAVKKQGRQRFKSGQ
jgi:hypothetical protein